MELIPRLLTDKILKRLNEDRIVILTGARQVGKTILVHKLLPSLQIAHYYNLDMPETRAFLRNNAYKEFSQHKQGTIIIDEIQKEPSLTEIVKTIVDENPGRKGAFLLLGSSQILLLKSLRERLAGRVGLVELFPFTMGEIKGNFSIADSLLKKIILSDNPHDLIQSYFLPYKDTQDTLYIKEQMLKWGGYPEMLQRIEDEAKKNWLSDYRRTYLERDLSDLGRVSDLVNFARCHQFIASRATGLLNYSDISKDIGLSVNTVRQYVHYLEISYQILLLQPYFSSTKKRLIKSPKIYFVDNGICRSFLDAFQDFNGSYYENWIVSEIFKLLSYFNEKINIYFYRTVAGAEIDLILEHENKLLPIEIKSAVKPDIHDCTALKRFCNEYRDKAQFGIVVYGGKKMEYFGDGIYAIPDIWLLSSLQK